MKAGRLPLLALLLLAGPPAIAGEEIVDVWEDGTPRLRYHVDDEGRFHGVSIEYFRSGQIAIKARHHHGELDGIYASFYENGKKRARAIYRRGARTGKYEEWDEQGRRTWLARYRNSLLHGRAEAWRDGEKLASQTWREGELTAMVGVRLSDRSRDDVSQALAGILEDAEPAPADVAAMDEARDRAVSLARLRAYRYLCGVVWEDVVLTDRCNDLAQAASKICAALGRITHEPPNPGWPPEEFQFAAVGARGCNLHQGMRAAGSVDGYMDDSDKRNIKTLGHRCWSLNPRMKVAGFGATRSESGKWFTAMWATDASRGKPPDLEAICYPPIGWAPVDLFGAHYAWSAQFGREACPRLDPANVTVTIHRLDDRFLPVGDALPLDYQSVNPNARGYPVCVIFRPAAFVLEPTADYLVAIAGLDPDPKKDVPFRYLVRWFERRASPSREAR